MENKIVRVGFIGLNDEYINSHLPFLLKNSHVKIVGATVSAERHFAMAEAVIEKTLGKDRFFKLKHFHDISDLLSEIDALIITSKGSDNGDFVEQACKTEVNVLCLGNMTDNISDNKLLFSFLSASSELVMTSFYPRRYNNRFMWIKREMNDLRYDYGKVCSIKIDSLALKGDSAKAASRDILMNNLVHDFDYMNNILKIKDTEAREFEAVKLISTSERYEIAGVRKDGMSFYFSRQEADNVKPNEIIELKLEKATVHIETANDNCYVYEHGTGKITNKTTHIPNHSINEALKELNDNFIYSILGETKPNIERNEIYSNLESVIGICDGDTMKCE